MIQHYCVGLLLRRGDTEVALIEKTKPVWQAGYLNGIGGKVEAGETPLAAMIREFREETGAEVTAWRNFCVLRGDDFCVHFFVSRQPVELLTGDASPTEEKVQWVFTSLILSGLKKALHGLRWQLTLAMDRCMLFAEVTDSVPNAALRSAIQV
jgi:8-oxo-dGTP diphosphatase